MFEDFSTEEEKTVIFNALKRVLKTSYSSLPIQGISARDLDLSKNSLLLKYKDQYMFFINPRLSIEDFKLKLYSHNKIFKFNKKQTQEIINYLYCSNYIEMFRRCATVNENEIHT